MELLSLTPNLSFNDILKIAFITIIIIVTIISVSNNPKDTGGNIFKILLAIFLVGLVASKKDDDDDSDNDYDNDEGEDDEDNSHLYHRLWYGNNFLSSPFALVLNIIGILIVVFAVATQIKI